MRKLSHDIKYSLLTKKSLYFKETKFQIFTKIFKIFTKIKRDYFTASFLYTYFIIY